MTATETTKSLQGYMSIPIAQLTESNTNPRKVFDAAKLKELVASIRSKGFARCPTREWTFEIVAGARRYRAAQRAGLKEIPARIGGSPMRKRLKFKSLKAFKGSTYIRLRRGARVSPISEMWGTLSFLGKDPRQCGSVMAKCEPHIPNELNAAKWSTSASRLLVLLCRVQFFAK
jgi:hypothetical protein